MTKRTAALGRIFILVVFALLATLLWVQRPASAATVSLAASWDVDETTNYVTYDLTLSGDGAGICSPGFCSWAIEGGYDDGTQLTVSATIGSGSRWVSSSGGAYPISVHLWGDNKNLPEISHVRGRIWAGESSAETAWIAVEAQPDGQLSLDVTTWMVDPATDLVDYDLNLTGVGLGGIGEPCESPTCFADFEAGFDSGSGIAVVRTLGSGTAGSGRTWTIDRRVWGSGKNLPEVTHVRGRVYYDTAERTTDWIPVQSQRDGNVDLEVVQWKPEAGTSLVDYDLVLSGSGLGGFDEPCQSTCSFTYEGGYDDGTQIGPVKTLATGHIGSGRLWTITKRIAATDRTLPAIYSSARHGPQRRRCP